MLVIKMKIDTNAAIMSGRALQGVINVELSDEHVQSLDNEERTYLVNLAQLSGAGDPIPGFVAQSPEEFLDWLRQRVAGKRAAARAEEERKAEEARLNDTAMRAIAHRVRELIDSGEHAKLVRQADSSSLRYERAPWVEGKLVPWQHATLTELRAEVDAIVRAKSAEAEAKAASRRAEEAEREKRKAERECLRAINVRELIPAISVDRYDAGFMPHDEQQTHVRDYVFAPLARFDRYAKIRTSDTIHADDCAEQGEIAFSTHDAEELTQEQYDKLVAIRACKSQIRALIGDEHEIEVEPREHVATCSECGQETRRVGALVTVSWFDWTLSREYAL